MTNGTCLGFSLVSRSSQNAFLVKYKLADIYFDCTRPAQCIIWGGKERYSISFENGELHYTVPYKSIQNI